VLVLKLSPRIELGINVLRPHEMAELHGTMLDILACLGSKLGMG
jgi:hypothetical protein